MTLSEFKAWLEGFSASFSNGTPDDAQWDLIQKKLASVSYYTAPLPTTLPKLPPIGEPWLSGPQPIRDQFTVS
ncbi:hypothetical protein ACFOLL_12755 [Falsochrobactrum ovis]|uniref:Uncharacterized protein n=1 Tax=Falsochrobactrum ovis TaxID=1293442 RepID=A0A364JSQ9_9HYPH|nr:hypothetical protein [Falsochrobactrum ovis]RAK26344.1 hypothetical protein C7374_11429 [Falsochrobactrum ovis]